MSTKLTTDIAATEFFLLITLHTWIRGNINNSQHRVLQLQRQTKLFKPVERLFFRVIVAKTLTKVTPVNSQAPTTKKVTRKRAKWTQNMTSNEYR